MGFAMIGLLMRALDFSFVTFIIGFVFGPSFELAFRQTMILADGEFSYLLDRPVALTIFTLAAAALARAIWRHVAAVRRRALID